VTGEQIEDVASEATRLAPPATDAVVPVPEVEGGVAVVVKGASGGVIAIEQDAELGGYILDAETTPDVVLVRDVELGLADVSSFVRCELILA
jgi:hypothetical protein